MSNVSIVSVDDIQVGKRHRRDLGDINGLAQSISDDGLFQPIGVTPDHQLVFGYRRLIACRDKLGWSEIPTAVIDIDNLTHGERVENTLRKDLTLSELVAITESLRSFARGGDRRSEQYRGSPSGVTKKRACEIAGWKIDMYDDARKVVDHGIPELIQAMDDEVVSPHAAARLADEPADIQREAVKKLEAAKTAHERRSILKTLRRIKNTRLLEDRRRAELYAPKDFDSVRLYHCSFQQLEKVANLKSETVQCVLTDIPYEGEFIDQLEDLARFAERVLVNGGVFVCYVGQHKLNEKLRILDEHLQYQWMGTSHWVGPASQMHSVKVVSNSTPFVVYTKGQRDRDEWIKWLDTLAFEVKEKEYHPWQKPLAEMECLLTYFTKPGDLVVDPCGGAFTTAVACQRLGRKCISCDTEKAYVVQGLERLMETKPRHVGAQGEALIDANLKLVEVPT